MLSITRIVKKVNHKSKWLASSFGVALVLASSVAFPTFAATYGEGAYGSNAYSAASGSSTSTGSGGTSGVLANTGQDVLLIVSAGAMAVGIGGAILLARKRARKHS